MPKVKYPQLQDGAWLREQYEVKQLTMYQIAELVGCNDGTVYFAMRRHGIQARPKRMVPFKPKACRGCRETFQPTSSCNLYCGACPQVRCTFCDEWFVPGKKTWNHYSAIFCSAEHRLEYLTAKETGPARRRVVEGGYVHVRVGVGYPGAYANGYMPEHRYVMQQHLGRTLLPHEEVHHKHDGDRSNNAIENLELWSTSQPKGQRVEDKIVWAREFLAQYGYEVSRADS